MDAKDDQSSGAEPESDAADASTEGYGLEPPPEPEPEPEPSAAIESADAVRTGSVGRATEPVTPVESETAPESVPLLPSGSWRPWAIAAGILLAVVCIAVLAGWSTFFPQRDGRFLDAAGKPVLDAPEISARFLVMARLILTAIFMVGCALPAFQAAAFFETRPVGDRCTGLARIGLAVSLAALVRLIPLGGGLLQIWVHLGLGLLVLIAGAFLLLRLRGPSLTLVMVSWGIAYVALGLFARVLTWGVPLF